MYRDTLEFYLFPHFYNVGHSASLVMWLSSSIQGRAIKGEPGIPGLDGTPGPRGLKGQDGNDGERGHGASEVFTLHSFSHSVPECPVHSSLLWEGYSLASLSLSHEIQPLSLTSTGSCIRQFSTVQTLGGLRANTDLKSVWLAEAPDQRKEGHNDDASRCAVCEMEGSLLTVHSATTHIPSCPPSWESLWSGFTYVSASAAVSFKKIAILIFT